MSDRITQALERSFAVIAALAEGELPFGVLRQHVGGLSAPTFSRLLKALVASGHVAASTNGYRLTPVALRHARTVTGALGPAEAVVGVLAELATTTAESAAFYVFRSGRVTLSATHVVPDSATYAMPGVGVPEFTRHGFAAACVLRADVIGQKRAFAACPRRRETSWTAFRDRLADGRRLGVVIEYGDHRAGILRVAAPVGAVGAIGVSSPRCTRAHAKTLIPAVLAAAQRLGVPS